MRFCGWAAKRPKRYAVLRGCVGRWSAHFEGVRTLLLLAALQIVSTLALGQSLKWTHTVPNPNVAYIESDLIHVLADGPGNVGLIVHYSLPLGEVGTQVVWLSATGKTLRTDFINSETLTFARILYVSATTLTVEIQRSNGTFAVRKFTKRGANVNFADTELGSATSGVILGSLEQFEVPASRSYFLVAQDTGGTAPIELRRYNAK